MPRSKKGDDELPSTLKRSDKHAQEIFEKTLASAEETYDGDEGAAHRVAYASLKHSYKKDDDGDKWVPKEEKGPSDPQAARGPTTRRKSTDPDKAPTARGKVAASDREAREKHREADRQYSKARREGVLKTGSSSRKKT